MLFVFIEGAFNELLVEYLNLVFSIDRILAFLEDVGLVYKLFRDIGYVEGRIFVQSFLQVNAGAPTDIYLEEARFQGCVVFVFWEKLLNQEIKLHQLIKILHDLVFKVVLINDLIEPVHKRVLFLALDQVHDLELLEAIQEVLDLEFNQFYKEGETVFLGALIEFTVTVHFELAMILLLHDSYSARVL